MNVFLPSHLGNFKVTIKKDLVPSIAHSEFSLFVLEDLEPGSSFPQPRTWWGPCYGHTVGPASAQSVGPREMLPGSLCSPGAASPHLALASINLAGAPGPTSPHRPPGVSVPSIEAQGGASARGPKQAENRTVGWAQGPPSDATGN